MRRKAFVLLEGLVTLAIVILLALICFSILKSFGCISGNPSTATSHYDEEED